MWAIVKGLTSGVQDQTQGFEGWTVNVNQSGAKINVRITFQVSDYFTTVIIKAMNTSVSQLGKT